MGKLLRENYEQKDEKFKKEKGKNMKEKRSKNEAK